MFAGDTINLTERRAVLHTALRAPRSESMLVDGWMWCPTFTRCWTA